MANLIWVIPMIGLLVFELIADVFSKYWSLHSKPIWWLAAITCYVIANIFWLYALRNGAGLSRGAIIFSVASAILAVVIGLLLFNEQISKTQIIGILLGITSLIFIFW